MEVGMIKAIASSRPDCWIVDLLHDICHMRENMVSFVAQHDAAKLPQPIAMILAVRIPEIHIH